MKVEENAQIVIPPLEYENEIELSNAELASLIDVPATITKENLPSENLMPIVLKKTSQKVIVRCRKISLIYFSNLLNQMSRLRCC